MLYTTNFYRTTLKCIQIIIFILWADITYSQTENDLDTFKNTIRETPNGRQKVFNITQDTMYLYITDLNSDFIENRLTYEALVLPLFQNDINKIPSRNIAWIKVNLEEIKYLAKHPINSLQGSFCAIYAASRTNTQKGLPNAVRHCFWAACATQKIGETAAKEITDNHENGSKNPSPMDFHNNEVGIRIGKENKNKSLDEIYDACLLAAMENKLMFDDTQVPPIHVSENKNNLPSSKENKGADWGDRASDKAQKEAMDKQEKAEKEKVEKEKVEKERVEKEKKEKEKVEKEKAEKEKGKEKKDRHIELGTHDHGIDRSPALDKN